MYGMMITAGASVGFVWWSAACCNKDVKIMTTLMSFQSSIVFRIYISLCIAYQIQN